MLEKNDLAGDSLKIVPRQYLPLISRGELLRKETFGSTGKCLEVYWSKEDYMRSMYSLWYYRKKYYGVTPADKRCSFDTMKGQDDQTGYERIFGIRNLTETRVIQYKPKKKKCKVFVEKNFFKRFFTQISGVLGE